MELAEHLVSFVELEIGNLVSAHKADTGASRISWFVESEKQKCVLRVDSGDGPVANTPLTLQREAVAYHTLAATNVRIPKLLARTDDALLIERAVGTDLLTDLSPEATEQVMGDYVDALSELHQFNPENLFESLNPPESTSTTA